MGTAQDRLRAADSPAGRSSVHDAAAVVGLRVHRHRLTSAHRLAGRYARPQPTPSSRPAAKLGYRPNHLGRALRRQSTQAIGMIVLGGWTTRSSRPSSKRPRVPPQPRSTTVASSSPPTTIRSSKPSASTCCWTRTWTACSADVHAAHSAAAIKEATGHAPVVQLDRGTHHYDGDFVAVDDSNGIWQLVTHVRETGRNDLADIGRDISSWSGARRFNAFTDAAPAVSADRILLGEFSEQWGHRGARRILSQGDPPDAVICGNDLIAIGVLTAAGELGVRIPEDLAVTGLRRH